MEIMQLITENKWFKEKKKELNENEKHYTKPLGYISSSSTKEIYSSKYLYLKNQKEQKLMT